MGALPGNEEVLKGCSQRVSQGAQGGGRLGSRRLGSGAQMTGCRNPTTVGETGTDRGWYGPVGPAGTVSVLASIWHFPIT